ncbi:MAG TPA: beta-ketoacyl-ACP synthase III [Chloroflexia bacterium]|nr:beta-ketoacyl-ACP synthase III [Chloroflexia bacterium]
MATYAAITGWGSAVPEKVLSNVDLEKFVDTTDEWISTRTGIRQRHVVSEGESTATLSVTAARKALDRAGVDPRKVDLIICCTATPDFLFPATACLIQNEIGADNAGAFDLEAACSGFIYGISVGTQFIKTGAYKTVLVVAAEALSRFIDWHDRATCVLFGDGAGAVVLQASDTETGLLSFVLGSHGSGSELIKLPAGGAALPASHETVDNHDHFIKMNGTEVYRFAVRIMGDSAVAALEKSGLDYDDLSMCIPHQANKRIISSIAERLKLPPEKVFLNIDQYANTSAASIPIALCEAADAGLVKPGDNILFVAFGAGLTSGAAIVRWGGQPN